MEYYRSYYTEALELSKTLPDEQSELYKRHFIPLPLEQFAERIENAGGGEEDILLSTLAKSAFENLNIKFDVLFGSTRHITNSADCIKIVDASDITEEHVSKKLFKSGDDKMVAFIHAHARRIVFIDVPDGMAVDINLLFANSDIPLSTQVLVQVGREARLNLFEWYASKSNSISLMSILHEIKVGEYGKADVNMVHNEDQNTFVVNFSKGQVLENGLLNINYIYNGGIGSRAKNQVSTTGYQARSNVIELVLGSGKQKFDLSTIISNVGNNTLSGLESKAALTDESVCILKGFADVGENAKGSRSFVNERGILLDKRCYMSSIPGMSIKNSDVKATHSSATMPVDEEALFYLMSRGATKAVAQKLLIAGFLSSSIAKMENPAVKVAVSSLMQEKINNKRFGTVPALDISNLWGDANAQTDDMFQGHYKYRELK